MASRVRGRDRVVFRISNRELWGNQRADAQRVGFRDLDAVKRNQRPLAERDFRSGRAGIPYQTGRLRRSLEFRPTSTGVSVVSNLVYYFQAEQAVKRWWSTIGRKRYQQALHNAIREEETRRRREDRRLREGASREELAALDRGDRAEHRRLRRNRLARENRRRAPEERARRAERRAANAASRRAEIRAEVRAARARRQERIASIQSRFRERHDRRATLLPRYRQQEYAAAVRATRTGRTRTPRGARRRAGGRYARRARRLLRLAQQIAFAAAGG